MTVKSTRRMTLNNTIRGAVLLEEGKMKDKVIYVLKIIIIIVMFPLFLRELGKYVDEIYDENSYSGGD